MSTPLLLKNEKKKRNRNWDKILFINVILRTIFEGGVVIRENFNSPIEKKKGKNRLNSQNIFPLRGKEGTGKRGDREGIGLIYGQQKKGTSSSMSDMVIQRKCVISRGGGGGGGIKVLLYDKQIFSNGSFKLPR